MPLTADELAPVAGGGLLDRRVFLKRFGAEAKTFEHSAIGKHEERGRFMVRPGGSVFRGGHERST